MLHGNTHTDRKFFSNPTVPCSGDGCDVLEYSAEDLTPCIACKRRFCADCLTVLGAEKYCLDCAKCACGEDALISCDECGALVCERHMSIDPHLNECLKCRRSGPDPDDLPAEAFDCDNRRCL